LNQNLVHPREVFADAIEERANSIIFVHNHPSGTCEPSLEDKVVTKNLVDASKIL
jgi:DNA repair protein RadC